MEIKVLSPSDCCIADEQVIYCAAAMRSTRTKESVQELLKQPWIARCRPKDLEEYECCRVKAIQQHLPWSAGWKVCRYDKLCAERMLLEAKSQKHWGVFEFAEFTVDVKGVSRALTHQLVRHRLFSYLQQSQRAVEIKMDEEWYVMPNSILEASKQEEFDQLMERIERCYSNLIQAGVKDEDARFVLPNATKTHIVIKGNGRNWLHFFRMRLESHAQWEIRAMAQQILAEFMKLSPVIFERAGELEV